jgi:hypothetical protein
MAGIAAGCARQRLDFIDAHIGNKVHAMGTAHIEIVLSADGISHRTAKAACSDDGRSGIPSMRFIGQKIPTLRDAAVRCRSIRAGLCARASRTARPDRAGPQVRSPAHASLPQPRARAASSGEPLNQVRFEDHVVVDEQAAGVRAWASRKARCSAMPRRRGCRKVSTLRPRAKVAQYCLHVAVRTCALLVRLIGKHDAQGRPGPGAGCRQWDGERRGRLQVGIRTSIVSLTASPFHSAAPGRSDEA